MSKELEVVQEIEGRRFLLAVETTGRAEDYCKYEQLRSQIWEDPEDAFSGPRNMASENYYNNGSSLFIGIFTEDEQGCFQKDQDHLAAFTFGYVGVKDKDIAYRESRNLVFYSQYAAVRPDFQGFNLGMRLKEFQKQKVQQILGVQTITCTFDPLVGVNAYRIIHALGMEIISYKDACYEGFAGRLNRLDVPSDRFWVSWDLLKQVSRPGYDIKELMAAGCLAVGSDVQEVQGKTGPIRLETAQAGDFIFADEGGHTGGQEPDFALVEIPYDYYRMLQETDVTDPEVRSIPLQWRRQTRQAFHALLGRGYRIIDFCYFKYQERLRDFYVLQRQDLRP